MSLFQSSPEPVDPNGNSLGVTPDNKFASKTNFNFGVQKGNGLFQISPSNKFSVGYDPIKNKYKNLPKGPLPKDFPKAIPFTPTIFEPKNAQPLSFGQLLLGMLDVPRSFVAYGELQGAKAENEKKLLRAQFDKQWQSTAAGKTIAENAQNKAYIDAVKKLKEAEAAVDEKYKFDFGKSWSSANAWLWGKSTVSGTDIIREQNKMDYKKPVGAELTKTQNDLKAVNATIAQMEAANKAAKAQKTDPPYAMSELNSYYAQQKTLKEKLDPATADVPLGQALLYDVVLDPLSLVNFDIGIPAKVIAKGTQYTVKGMKEAIKGKVSTQFLANSTGDLKLAETGATPFRPYENVLNQYSAKPSIKQNLVRRTGPMADVLQKLDTKVANNFYYSMTPAKATLQGVVASGLEAGWKAAATTFLTSVAKNKLAKIAEKEAFNARVPLFEVPRAIDSAGKEFEIQAFVPHVTDNATYVYDGSNLHKFKTEDEAKAWVTDSKNPKAAKTKAVPATYGLDPIVDTKPLVENQSLVKQIPATTTVAQDAKKTLKTIDTLISKVTGISRANDVVAKLSTIVNRMDVGTLPIGLSNAIREVTKRNGDAFQLVRELTISGSPKNQIDVAKAFLSREVIGTDGVRTSIQDLYKNAKWSSLDAATKKQIIAQLDTFLGGSAGAQAGKLNEIAALVGSETAAKIAATGVLDPAAKTNQTALQQIINNIPSLTQKKYGSMTELVKGLKGGDIVDLKILEKLVNAVDPEAATRKVADQALTKEDEYARLSGILIAKGVDTVEKTKLRVAAMNGVSLMNAQGLSLGDVIGAHAELRLTGKVGPAEAALVEARAKAADDLTRWSSGPFAGELRRTYESINQGLGGQFDYLAEIKKSKDLFTGITTTKDLAIRSTEKAFQAKTKAALLNLFTANTEAKMLANMFGLIRRDLTKATVVPTPLEIFNKFLLRGEMMDTSILAVMGGRFSYRKAALAAKGEKHYIYMSLAKTAQIFKETGGTDAFINALIPNTKKIGILKTDALSFVGVSKATRYVMEMVERNLPINKDLLLKELKSRGEQQTKWSTAWKNQVDKAASDFADHLTSPAVIEKLQEAHKLRALATVEDSLSTVTILVEDMWKSLEDGMKANAAKNLDSPAARAQLVRDYFYKFVYNSGILKQQSGEVTQAVFEAAAMIFVCQGKLEKLAGETGTAQALIGSASRRATEEERALNQQIVTELNSMYKRKNADLNPNIDANRVPFPTKAAVSKASNDLTEAKLAYEAHIDARATLTTKAQVTAWKTKFDKLQAKLDAARLAAYKVGVPTHHWQNGEWVPTQYYNHEIATQNAKNNADALLTLEDGVAKLPIVDTISNYPTHKRLSAAETKRIMDKWTKDNAQRNVDAMRGAQEEAAQDILNNIDQIEALGLSDAETAKLVYTETIARPYNNSEMTTLYAPVTYGKGYRNSEIYNNQIAGFTRRGRFAEKYNAPSGRGDVQGMLTRAEATLMNEMTNMSKSAAMIAKKWKNVFTPDEMGQAIKIALSHNDAPATANKMFADLVQDMRQLLHPVFGNPQTTEIVANGIHPELLANSLRRFGLTDTLGEIPATLQAPNELAGYADWLPFVGTPDNVLKNGTAAEKEAFAARVEAFKASGIDPLVMTTRLVQAVSFAKMEQRIVSDFASRFGWKADPTIKSMEDAIKHRGYVRLEGIGGGSGTDFTKMLPSPEQGGLYPAEIARQFASLNREFNKIYNSEKMSKIISGAMEIVGAIKATQTIFRLGHHATNIQSDAITAVILGARNPVDWYWGAKLAARYAGKDISTSIGANKLENQLANFARIMEEPNKNFETVLADGSRVPTLTINTGKKGQRVQLSEQDLLTKMENYSVSTTSYYSEDLQGLYEVTKTMADGSGPAQQKLGQYVGSKILNGIHKIEQPVGSATAYYSNITRIALAMHLLRSRSWKSLDEAFETVSVEVNRAFPTIHALAASERKYPRTVIMYYTWLRVAGSAFIDMALNHTSAMLIPARLNREQSEIAGIDTTSLGNAWGDKTRLPSYKTYSVYGPTAQTREGLMRSQMSNLPMDILDSIPLQWDAAYTPEENIFKAVAKIGTEIGSSTNPFIQRTGEWINGVDWQTGQKSQVTDLKSLGESVLSDLGFANLLKGTGIYTPSNRGPESKNPITPQDRQRYLQNWMFGGKNEVLDTGPNLNNAKQEQSARMKSIKEIMQGKK